MRYLFALLFLTWAFWRVLWMSMQRQAGDIGPSPESQPGARKTFSVSDILQELKDQGIDLPPEWQSKIRMAVTQQQSQKFELARQGYVGLEKAQVKPNGQVYNLFERSKKLAHNFALLQEALKAQGK